MNIVFMGTPEFSVGILEKLHHTYPVSLVVSQPDRKVGRKKELTMPPVKEKALELGIPVFQPRNIKEDYQTIIDHQPDIIITAAYGQIIPQEIIDYPRLGCINVHGSLLPKLRGGAPIQRAIERMHKVTGITIMYMKMKMDSGNIISQREIPILPNETSGTLFEKLSKVGEELLLETLPSIFDGTNKSIPQNEEEVTYAYNLKREEEKIDWNMTISEIDHKLRAFTPGPYLYTTLDDKQIKIFEIELHQCSNFIKHHSEQACGTIIKIFEDSIGVKAKDGVIKIKELQLAGKKRQDTASFMQGSGRNLIKVNKIFK